MDITIKASDGKLFKGTNYLTLVAEVNAHESDLKLKKQRKEEEEKARAENLKKFKQYRESKLNEINDVLHKANDMIVEYEKNTGRKVAYGYDYAAKSFMVTDTIKTLDSDCYNVANEILKSLKGWR